MRLLEEALLHTPIMLFLLEDMARAGRLREDETVEELEESGSVRLSKEWASEWG